MVPPPSPERDRKKCATRGQRGSQEADSIPPRMGVGHRVLPVAHMDQQNERSTWRGILNAPCPVPAPQGGHDNAPGPMPTVLGTQMPPVPPVQVLDHKYQPSDLSVNLPVGGSGSH